MTENEKKDEFEDEIIQDSYKLKILNDKMYEYMTSEILPLMEKLNQDIRKTDLMDYRASRDMLTMSMAVAGSDEKENLKRDIIEIPLEMEKSLMDFNDYASSMSMTLMRVRQALKDGKINIK